MYKDDQLGLNVNETRLERSGQVSIERERKKETFGELNKSF